MQATAPVKSRRFRPAQPPNAQAAEQAIAVKIGTRLKHARLARAMKLRELAEKVGCTDSYLSKLENDKVTPSLSVLHKLVRELGINIAMLFDPVEEEGAVRVTRQDQRVLMQLNSRGKSGISIERLISAGRSVLLEAGIIHIAPGGHTEGALVHDGEEVGYVLEGELHLEVEGRTYLLSVGDCFCFRSELSHRYGNPGATPTRVAWVCTPPTF